MKKKPAARRSPVSPRKTQAASTKRSARAKSASRRKPLAGTVAAAPVTAEELRLLQQELERRLGASASKKARSSARRGHPVTKSSSGLRWNPDPEDVQKSVAQLVLTVVEFLRRLMERQAVRRMEANTLTDAEVEAVGAALMTLEQTVRDIGARFGLTPEDLNLDLGPIKLM